MTTNSRDIEILIREQMDAAHEEMHRILATAFYGPQARPLFASFTPPPSRARRIYWRVRGYVSTLWLALRGADLSEDTGDNY